MEDLTVFLNIRDKNGKVITLSSSSDGMTKARTFSESPRFERWLVIDNSKGYKYDLQGIDRQGFLYGVKCINRGSTNIPVDTVVLVGYYNNNFQSPYIIRSLNTIIPSTASGAVWPTYGNGFARSWRALDYTLPEEFAGLELRVNPESAFPFAMPRIAVNNYIYGTASDGHIHRWDLSATEGPILADRIAELPYGNTKKAFFTDGDSIYVLYAAEFNTFAQWGLSVYSLALEPISTATSEATRFQDPILLPDGQLLIYTPNGDLWDLALCTNAATEATVTLSRPGLSVGINASEFRSAYYGEVRVMVETELEDGDDDPPIYG